MQSYDVACPPSFLGRGLKKWTRPHTRCEDPRNWTLVVLSPEFHLFLWQYLYLYSLPVATITKSLQLGDLKQQKLCSQLWWPGVPDQGSAGPHPLGRLWGRILLWLSQPLAVPCILGLCHQNFSLCLCPHTVISPVCLCPSLLFLEGHPLYWIGTHPKSVWPCLNLVTSAKDPNSK